MKRVNPELLANRDAWEVIRLADGDEVVGAVELRTGEEELVFLTSDAQLLHFGAAAVRPQGRSGGGIAGVRLAAEQTVVFFGAFTPDDSAVVVTVSGSGTALPGTEPGAVKVTPFAEYPAKGRGTGGVRCHRFLKGEDTLVLRLGRPRSGPRGRGQRCRRSTSPRPTVAATAPASPARSRWSPRPGRWPVWSPVSRPSRRSRGHRRPDAPDRRGVTGCAHEDRRTPPARRRAHDGRRAVGLLGLEGRVHDEPVRHPGRREEDPRRDLGGAHRPVHREAAQRRERPARRDGVGTHAPAFKGTIKVAASGITADAAVVAVDGTVHAKLPFTSKFVKIDPADYGAPDPAALMSPDAGLSSLLTAAEDVTEGAQVREGKVVLSSFSGTVPGQAVAEVIPSASATATFDATFTVTDDDELAKAVLTGPFYPESDDVTYTITFDDYGTKPTITAP